MNRKYIFAIPTILLNIKMRNQIICLLVAFMALTSCSSDDDKGSTGSREIKYEVTGNFSGEKLDVTYTVNGGVTSSEVTSLPWSHTFTADSNTMGASLSAGGFGATPGEKITIKIFQGNTEKASVEGTVNSSGIVAVVANAAFN